MQTRPQILSEALLLPPVDRAVLIEELFFSFDGTERSRLDQLWASEVESRIDAYERGEFGLVPAETVFARLDQ